MQTLDEKPETIHLYVVREEEPKPSVFPVVLSALSLTVLFALCALTPYQQPELRPKGYQRLKATIGIYAR
jgi:hypothetical protein